MKNKLQLDCSKQFNPESFIGKGWEFDGAGQNPSTPKVVDFSKVEFVTCLKKGEEYITGEEKLKRIKEPLGANAFLALWQDYQKNKKESVLEWLREERKITYMDFFGDVLRSPYGGRCVLCFVWYDGAWGWVRSGLGDVFSADGPSAVSPQVSSQTSEPSTSGLESLPLELVINGVTYQRKP